MSTRASIYKENFNNDILLSLRIEHDREMSAVGLGLLFIEFNMT